MIAAVVLRAGLPFGIRFDEKPAEIRNELVDLVGLGLPPRDDAGIERIGGLQATEPHRRGEVRRQIHAQPVRPPQIGQRCDFGQVLGRQDEHVGVDAVDDRAVDADRGVRARVVDVSRADASPGSSFHCHSERPA